MSCRSRSSCTREINDGWAENVNCCGARGTINKKILTTHFCIRIFRAQLASFFAMEGSTALRVPTGGGRFVAVASASVTVGASLVYLLRRRSRLMSSTSKRLAIFLPPCAPMGRLRRRATATPPEVAAGGVFPCSYIVVLRNGCTCA